MNNKFTLFSILSLGLFSSSAGIADESIEPPLGYQLKMGEKVIEISEGKSFTLPKTDGGEAVLQANPTRFFTYSGLRFSYPADFTFEADLDSRSFKAWILSGNDCKIQVYSFANKVPPSTLAKNMQKRFGEGMKPGPISITLNGNDYQGVELKGTMIGGIPMSVKILDLGNFQGNNRLLLIQDSPHNNDSQSAEAKATLALLDETLE